MRKSATTKRALLMSALSLILCVSMLVGSTFAWFTDTVTSANNIIKSGNLDVELYHTNSYITTAEKVGGLTDLFTVEEGKSFLWEPGAVLWENFTVANEGDLAVKYQLSLNFQNATQTVNGKTLADVLKVAIVPGGFNGTRTDAQALSFNYTLKTFAVKGEIEAGQADDVYGIVIYWEPTASDNDYNVEGGLSIELGVKLFATQLTAESDSFGPEYDANAPMEVLPDNANASASIKNDGSTSVEVPAAPSTTTNKTIIDAPAGTFKPTDKVEVKVETVNSLYDVNVNGEVVASLDITLIVNGTPTSMDLEGGKVFTVTTYIPKGLTLTAGDLSYTGTDGKAQPTLVSYDKITGKLVFTTSHFSEYAVEGEGLAYDTKTDTVYTTIEEVITAAKTETGSVVIPEENKDAIKAEIEALPAEEQEAATAATSAAKIGDVTYATLSAALAEIKDGDTMLLLNSAVVNADTVTSITGKVTIDLNGKTISGVSTKTGANRSLIVVGKGGDLTVKNGTVTMEHKGANMGWNNSTNALEAVSGGKLTLDNLTVKNLGGSDMAYAVNIANNGGATLKTIKSTLESVNYVALRIFNNADGEINVDLTNGTKLTGASSPFFVHFWSEKDLGAKQAARQAYLNMNFNDTQVSRYSGSKSLVRFGFDDAIYYSSTAMTEVVAGNETALLWALENGKDVLFNCDITVEAKLSNAYGKTGLNVTMGQTIDGNGYTLKVTGASATWDSAISTTGGVIKNLTVAQGFCGIFVNHNSTHSETVVLDKVTIHGPVYAINCDQGTNQNMLVTNSTINGWTSFATTIGTVKFENCKFGKGAGYKTCVPYAPAEFIKCDFVEGYEMYLDANVSFDSCTLADVTLTNDNLANLVLENISKATIK